MSTKILFTDIDGTLLRSDKTISETLLCALRELAANGHGLVLSSGRPLSSILTVWQGLGIELPAAYIIAHNGALVYDINADQPILEKPFPMELVDAFQDAAAARSLHIQTYTLKEVVSPKWNEEITSYKNHIRMPVLISPRLSDALDYPPYKMLSIHLTDHDALVRFRDELDSLYTDRIQTLFSTPQYLEMICKDASKGDALRFLCAHLNVPIENSVAVGDSDNDLSMLLAAGYGYAMQNASEKIKSSADFTTALDNDHDGILEIIKKHFL